MSIGSVMPSNHLVLCHPLLLLPSIFPRTKTWCGDNYIWPQVLLAIQILGWLDESLVGSVVHVQESSYNSEKGWQHLNPTGKKEHAHCLLFAEIGAMFAVEGAACAGSRSQSRHAPRCTPTLTLVTPFQSPQKSRRISHHIGRSQTLRSFSPFPNLHVWITSPALDRLYFYFTPHMTEALQSLGTSDLYNHIWKALGRALCLGNYNSALSISSNIIISNSFFCLLKVFWSPRVLKPNSDILRRRKTVSPSARWCLGWILSPAEITQSIPKWAR